MLNHQDLMARGLANLNEIDGEQGDKVMQALADISPDLGKYIIGFAFGEIYQRPQLDVRQRELVTLRSPRARTRVPTRADTAGTVGNLPVRPRLPWRRRSS